MLVNDRIWVGHGETEAHLMLNQANRHGLIAGASGTGKTVTLKVLAEAFSQAGVPVFMADVKGDVTGMAQPGADTEAVQKRVTKFGIENWSFAGCPCRFWEVAGVGAGTSGAQGGIPVRITVSEMGPTLLSRLLGLTDVQEGVLNIVFRVADDMQMLLIDLKDLRALLNYVAEHSDEYTTTYGNVASASVGAILRALIALEDQGGDEFFGEPSLELADWFACNEAGQGYVNILNAERLIQSPQVYAMFLLWMMSELFEKMPEEGDLDKPKFVFFFDEAHLLFNGMPKELLNKLIQVVKLIRSKGIGIYFITQSPSDIPDEVLAQLSNRIQHGLRAYTPAEQKAVKAAAQAFRVNPAFDSAEVILELGTGEALVSCLNEDGQPSVVERCKILPPQCLMAVASQEVIDACIAEEQPLLDKYGKAIDRKSAYETITGTEAPDADPAQESAEDEAEQPTGELNAAAVAAAAAGGAGAVAGAAGDAAATGEWTCKCGAVNKGKFCMECGEPKPADPDAWTCSCGAVNKGKFCMECGSPSPKMTTGPWTCTCGVTNEGKFCMECGKSRQEATMSKEELRNLKANEKEKAAQEKAAAKEKAEKEKAAKKAAEKKAAQSEKTKKKVQDQAIKTASSVVGQIGRETSRQLVRGIFKSLK